MSAVGFDSYQHLCVYLCPVYCTDHSRTSHKDPLTMSDTNSNNEMGIVGEDVDEDDSSADEDDTDTEDDTLSEASQLVVDSEEVETENTNTDGGCCCSVVFVV